MFHKKGKGKDAMCLTCSVVGIVLSVFAGLATLAALIGVYKAHFPADGAVFGATSGSLALIALAINMFLVKKLMSNCSCQCSK